MAATVSLRVFTGANAATMSGAVTGLDMVSADNALNSQANRNAFPIPAGGFSYEKWLKARVDAAPANQITNFRVWSDGDIGGGDATLWAGVTDTGATPTNADSAVATVDLATATVASKLDWDTSSVLVDVGDLTDFLVLQLEVDSGAEPGDLPTETVSYSYDEQ